MGQSPGLSQGRSAQSQIIAAPAEMDALSVLNAQIAVGHAAENHLQTALRHRPRGLDA